MKIAIDLTVYELDDEDLTVDRPDFAISSHWNRDNLVVISVGGHRYTLSAEDLIKATKRAQGWKW